ncbi:MAG: PmeII family type II restriction endonuclease [Nostocaceae cyanobacterium]|nr:PmeII family type II restriction endonuclease [Nostocaceae cyanobacterium]
MSVETKRKISEYLESLIPGVQKSANSLTLKEIMNHKNPLVREMFHNNPQEFITFFVMERVERSFVTSMGNMIENIVEILVQSQGGEIIGTKKDWQPYDLKFCLRDGKEYWLEIKSILNQNHSNKKTINLYKDNAIKQGKEFRLCIYYPTKLLNKEDYVLVGKEFWSFVGGDEATQSEVFSLIRNTAKGFSFTALVHNRTEALLQEYNNPSSKVLQT